MIRRLAALFPLFALFTAGQAVNPSDVLNTPHNLSAGGPGPVTSGKNEACLFCHISHSGYTDTGYLWNQTKSSAAYTPYQSSTLDAAPGNPGAASSKMCLSCHDGTIALGDTVASGTIPMSGSMSPSSVTGTDFGRHHPVGITPVDDGQLYSGLTQDPAQSKDPAVRLPNNMVECLSCHEPHSENRDAVRGKFLVRSNSGSAICLACHEPAQPPPNVLNGWFGSAHQSATNARNELYGNVAENACLSCHAVHNGTNNTPLLRDAEEQNCAVCHAGSGTTPVLLDVMSQFNRIYAHPTTIQAGLHDAGENAFPLNSNRHAECPDCHNPHGADKWTANPFPPTVPAALSGATGVDRFSGQTPVRPAQNEYEVCFKCHADSTGKPQSNAGYNLYGRTPWRQLDQNSPDRFNTRLEFNSLISRHNVTQPRQHSNSQVPSLRPAMLKLNGAQGRSLSSGTYIYCTDCHDNEQSRADGGSAASGPHGSLYPHILERRYETEPPPAMQGGQTAGVVYQAGLNGTYALCNKCHDIEGSIRQDQSFKEHREHLDERVACSSCHDPHGINNGNLTNNPWLINFDLSIVGPSMSGKLRFEQTGDHKGRCYLRCHGRNHNPKSY